MEGRRKTGAMAQTHGRNPDRLTGSARARHEDAAAVARLVSFLQQGLAQDLVHLRFELELLVRHPELATADALEPLVILAGELLEDVTALIRELVDDEATPGLTDALRAYCRGLPGSMGARVRIHGEEAVRLPPPMQGAVVRIACDTIEQALRHGGVETVDVHVSTRSGDLVLEVADDGWRPGTPGDRRAASRRRVDRQLESRAARLHLEVDRCTRPGASNVVQLRARAPLA